ncbi:MAG: hypothetical protein IPP15_00145 [Saprospiraceae bacterium]|uniref:Uncharacterized protein n=1 Tax=Candidatus Opimibacter skivensis TaxID=2982028 RepID=A0A9D7XM66_9BACT|nr:hypothetical protein [Candidatus Opimibacter skivensis]
MDKIIIDYPYLIKIYLASDDINIAIPIDIIEIKSPSDKAASLILKHKKQIAIVVNNKGDRQEIRLRKQLLTMWRSLTLDCAGG